MYQAYYNLGTDPFRLTPDPDFRFLHQRYAQALARLEHALRQGAGLVVLTGRSGTGKTLLINELCTKQDEEQVRCVRIAAAHLDKKEELLHAIAAAFESVGAHAAGEKPLHWLKDFLQRQAEAGHRYLVALDECQDGSLDAIVEVAALARLRTAEKRPLLQILLAGPPSLARQLSGIGIISDLSGLDEHETSMYIEHRLRHAGWQGDPQITAPAFKTIHALAQGIPRGINLICGRVLLYGACEGKHQLDVADVQTVAAELRDEALFDPECLPSLTASHPPWPELPQDPVSADALDSSQVMREEECAMFAPARVARPAAGARRTVRKTDVIDRRGSRRRRTISYAAAGSLLTATLLAALYDGGTDSFRELPFAERFGYLAQPAVSTVADRMPETVAPRPSETTAEADESLLAFEDGVGPSPAPTPSFQNSPAGSGADDASLREPTQAHIATASGPPEEHALDAEPGGTDLAHLRNPDDGDSAATALAPATAASGTFSAADGAAPPQRQTSYQVTQVHDYQSAGRDCRQYTLEATITDKRQRLYATACREPDGTWGEVQYPEAFYRPVKP
jgi:general secretion pathway protein A